jgi:hypothetical protein
LAYFHKFVLLRVEKDDSPRLHHSFSLI